MGYHVVNCIYCSYRCSNIPFDPVTTNTCSVAKIYFFESSIGDSQNIISSKKESRPAFTKFPLFFNSSCICTNSFPTSGNPYPFLSFSCLKKTLNVFRLGLHHFQTFRLPETRALSKKQCDLITLIKKTWRV